MPTVPQLPSADRVKMAYQDRNNSDYIANFWTAFGWSILTCGIYSYYMFYQLMRRDRDHNRRRLELLDGATAHAWEVAGQRGLQDELRPNFERLSGHVNNMRGMTSDFRDPVIWLVLALLTGIATLVAFIFMDQDLVKHETAEMGAQIELSEIYRHLGVQLSTGPAVAKGNHSYGGRIVASIFTGGLYFLWWLADIMREGNNHFQANWVWEDELANAVVTTAAA